MVSRPFNFCRTSCNWAARSSSAPLPCDMLALFVTDAECSEIKSQILYPFGVGTPLSDPLLLLPQAFLFKKPEDSAIHEWPEKKQGQFEAHLHCAMTGPSVASSLFLY